MTKPLSLILGIAALGAATMQAHAENVITWETLGNTSDSTGQSYVQRFTIEADGPFERMAFCMFKRGMEAVNPTDTIIELLPGYFAVASPRFAQAQASEPVVVDIRTAGVLANDSYRPDGMHLVSGGRAVPVRVERKSMTAFPAQYAGMVNGQYVDKMIYGPEAFAINDSLRTSLRPGPYGGIPTLKSVTLTGDKVKCPQGAAVRCHYVGDDRTDYVHATIDDSGLTIYTNSAVPEAVVAQMMRRVQQACDAEGCVPAAVIEDWADLPYRGLMIDVVRNYIPVAEVKLIIDLMAGYGLNVLHFHLGDDEAWRLEIPSLPELTEVASTRGYCTDDDQPFLKQIYSGDGLPDSPTPANGHITADEYVDLLRYAHRKGVEIVPEFDTPGHSRAAIRAMEHRYRQTGDDSLRLIHDGDTSVYTSAQEYHDNIMNPALEGPYRFWDLVMGDIVDMYAKAGAPLRAIHIGGDEVPRHAWDGSDAVKALMVREGLQTQGEVHARFVERVAEIAERHGVKIMGWQEIALDHSPEYDATVQPVVAGVNCWTNTGKNGTQMAEKGYPLILSNVDYLYFDQIPTSHPEEPGLKWGGIVDEFAPLHATVDRLCPGSPKVQANVAGISAQLFSETVRSPQMVQRYITPRLLGLAERGHNIKPTLTDAEYFGVITAEMPRWAADGLDFYLRQPGIRVHDGLVEMNDAYGLGEIRYTLDGSDPTADSTLYTAPFPAPDATQVRARLYYGPARSVTSILPLR